MSSRKTNPSLDSCALIPYDLGGWVLHGKGLFQCHGVSLGPRSGKGLLAELGAYSCQIALVLCTFEWMHIHVQVQPLLCCCEQTRSFLEAFFCSRYSRKSE